MNRFLDENLGNLVSLNTSNCQDAMDDEIIAKIAACEDPKLELLDISYCKKVTDAGLASFESSKDFPIKHLCINGLMAVSGKGLFHLIDSCKKTLEIYLGACINNEEMKQAEFGKALGYCFNLMVLDVGGCNHISDEFFQNLGKGEIKEDDIVKKPGFQYMHTVKLNMLENINDGSVAKILAICPELENLELTGCVNLTEDLIEKIFKNNKNLQYVDLNHIPIMTPAFYEVLKGHRPNILMRKFKIQEVDPKDNGLRIPWRIAKEKKAGKKGKKGKKKK